MSCPHENTEPVYAYLHRHPVKVGDEVIVANDGNPVARICTACLAQLHTGWGCPACTWSTVSIRRLCDPHDVIEHHLERPCQEHA